MQHLQKTQGWVRLWLTRHATKHVYPERPSGVKDLFSHFYPEGHRDEGPGSSSLATEHLHPLRRAIFSSPDSSGPAGTALCASRMELRNEGPLCTVCFQRKASFASSSLGSYAPPSASASALSSFALFPSLPNPAPWTALSRPSREPVKTTPLPQSFNLATFQPSNASLFCIPSGPASPSSPPSSSSTTSSDPSISWLSISSWAWPSPDGSGIEPRSFASPASQQSSVPTIFLGLLAVRHFDFQLSAFNFQLFFSSPLLPPSSRFAAPLLANTTTLVYTARKPFAGSSPARWSPAWAIYSDSSDLILPSFSGSRRWIRAPGAVSRIIFSTVF